MSERQQMPPPKKFWPIALSGIWVFIWLYLPAYFIDFIWSISWIFWPFLLMFWSILLFAGLYAVAAILSGFRMLWKRCGGNRDE
jgi:hypothetical protein